MKMEISSHHEEQVPEIPMPLNSSFVGVHAHAYAHHHHHHHGHGHITHHHPSSSSSSHNHHNNSNGGINTIPHATIMEEHQSDGIKNHNHDDDDGDDDDEEEDDDHDDNDDLGSKMMKKKMMVRYRECQKNHAASMGGNATDGCGEFMPSGEEGTLESLTCSACNCHRNFHRKEIQGHDDNGHHHIIPQAHSQFYPCTPQHHLLNTRGRKVILGSSPSGLGYLTGNSGPLVPFTRSLPINMPPTYTPSDQSDHHHGNNNGGSTGMMNMMARPYNHNHNHHDHNNQVVKKRFRTKFSQEQKEKMFEFAEKVGWKIQKQEESVVQQFCAEIGVKRRVLKVWMHNNKHNSAKKISDNIIDNNIINH